jgi:hypothetical protein
MAEIFRRNNVTGKFERVTRNQYKGAIRLAAANGARRNPQFMNN